jgi:hypothetical protein
VSESPDKHRRFAPVFFGLAAIVAVLGIAQFVHGVVKSFPMTNNVLVLFSDLLLAGVMVAIALRLMKPAQRKQPPPLRAPRPPR